MPLHNAEHTFRGEHLGTVSARNRFALFRRHLIDALIFRPAGAQRSKDVRHTPNAILIGHQEVIVPPGEAIRSVEVLHMPFDPIGPATPGSIAQQRQIAGALLRYQHVAIGQDQQAARIDKAGYNGVASNPGGTCGTWPS